MASSEGEDEPLRPKASTSTILHHTVPPFYACYLLRSIKSTRTVTYIGSTPDPFRRIKQHNGIIQGGAFKTSKGRPWEMELIVYGFPTKLQALQFEWAWQNPHLSRHLRTETVAANVDKAPAQFPRTPLSNRPLSKIQVLQFMLTVAPWKDFNLSLRCFSVEAQSWWAEARSLGPSIRTDAMKRKWLKDAGAQNRVGVDPWGARAARLDLVVVSITLEGVDGTRLVRLGTETENAAKHRADDDDFFLPHWQKWIDLIAPVMHICSFCKSSVDTTNHLNFTICPIATCTFVAHLPCFAFHFLSASFYSSAPSSTGASASTAKRPLLPTTGHCPSCEQSIHWQDLIRGNYRRWEELGGGERKKKSRIVVEKKSKAKGRVKNAISDDETERKSEQEEEEAGERDWAYLEAAEGSFLELEIDVEDDFEIASTPIIPLPANKKMTTKKATKPNTTTGLRFATSKPSSSSSKKPKIPLVAPKPAPTQSSLASQSGEEEGLPDVATLLSKFKSRKASQSVGKQKVVYLEISD